jgi:Phage terminase large subunit
VISYTPQPRQKLLHGTDAQQILYGGSAGGGKSFSVRWDGIDFAVNLPGFQGVIFRRTGPQLEKNHIKFVRSDARKLGAEWNETRKTLHWPNGSEIAFKHIEHEKDVEDIQGWEIHWSGIDEAGQMTEHQLEYIKSRMRISEDLRKAWVEQGKGAWAAKLPRYVMSANPGGVSHHYLKERYIDPHPPETVFCDPYSRDDTDPDDKGSTTIFIPASIADNKYLGKEYRRQFAGMADWQRKMLRDGDWNVVAGAFFDCWSPANIVPSFKVPAHWTRFRSMDWGFATPFSVGWWAVSDGGPVTLSNGESRTFPEGCLVRYREWYGCGEKRNSGLRMDGFDVGRGIRERESRPLEFGHREYEDIRYSVADPSMWKADSGPSQAEKLSRAKCFFRRADNQRISGWQQMYSRIQDRMLVVFDTCHHFIRTIPVMERDTNDFEDLLKRGEDHIADECRYACMSRPYIKSLEAPVDPYEELLRPQTYNDLHEELVRSKQDKRVRI